MTEDQQRRLERLMYYRTRYELVATHPTKGTYLVCYTSKKSFKGLTESISSRGVALCRAIGVDPMTATWTPHRKPVPYAEIGEWTVRFTGRTQRDVVVADDEPPFIGV